MHPFDGKYAIHDQSITVSCAMRLPMLQVMGKVPDFTGLNAILFLPTFRVLKSGAGLDKPKTPSPAPADSHTMTPTDSAPKSP